MKVTREFSTRVQFILDELVPPILRDSSWFMFLPMKLVLRQSSRDFMTFKNDVFHMSESEFSDLYARTASSNMLQGDTDLNHACVEKLRQLIVDENVLEVGCGRGFLSNLLSERNTVAACDIAIDPALVAKYPNVSFTEANIESLPFENGQFDVVVCTHTLEHVQHLGAAMAELRRVARKQLIVVVPRQRPYKYTFSLHVHFFPYRWALESALALDRHAEVYRLDDWLIVENQHP